MKKDTLSGVLEQGTGIDLHFRFAEIIVPLGQALAGNSPPDCCIWMGSIPIKKDTLSGVLEQGTGIEPAFTAWEAVVLPIYEPCVWEVL